MVLCTALDYDGSKSDPTITSLTIRDPWPDKENAAVQGRQVWSGMELGPRIMSIWTVQSNSSTETASTASSSTSQHPNHAVTSVYAGESQASPGRSAGHGGDRP